jgi:succinate-acetate transporter protein
VSTPAEEIALAERRDMVRVTLRPIGHPLPLGFLGLTAATIVVSGLQLGWYRPTEGRTVALVLIAFVFPVQLVSSIFGFLGRDSVAGTAMGVLAGTWLTVGLVPCLVLVTTSLRFFVTGFFQITGSDGWKTTAGVTGLVLAAFAVYAALAIELADATGVEHLPLLRRGKGAIASRGTIDQQVADVEHEAGVRQQL